MIVERGRVLAVDQDSIWVRVARRSACGSCASSGECGNGVMGRLLGSRATDIRVRREPGQQVNDGDSVDIGIADDAVLSASLIAYGIPLIALLAGAIIGAGLDNPGSDSYSMLLGAVGMVAGWMLARTVGQSRFARSEPTLLSVTPGELKTSNVL